MNNYANAGVNSQVYELCKNTQIQNRAKYSEQSFGSRRSLFVKGNMIATTAIQQNLDIGKLTNQQFVSFLGRFNRQLYQQFQIYPVIFDQEIKHLGVARDKNIQLWDKLEVGSYFYNIDLSSAYWQVAYRLGYIDPTMFEKYLRNDDFKQAKRYCISFLARRNFMTYENDVKITCDTSFLVRVYDNIRQELYKIIETAVNQAETYLEYNIDGISVMADKVDVVKKCFKDEGLLFKITQCRVMPDNRYLYGHKTRKFKNK